jgi:hypothetical protein
MSKILNGISNFLNNKKKEFLEFTKNVAIDKELQNCLMKYGIIYIFILIVIIILSFAANDKNALTTKSFVYIFALVVPFIILYSYFMNKVKNRSPKYYFLIYGLLLLFLLITSYYFGNLKTSGIFAISYMINLVLFLIVIIGLSIFYYIYSNYLKSLSGWSGFFVYLLFYIPCLFISFITYIFNEFKMTTNIVFILFIIEIILLFLYFYLPKVINNVVNKNGIMLLDKPVFLDKEIILASSNDLKMPNMDTVTNTNTYSYNYSISLWVYLNEQSTSNKAYSKETTIFNYGNGKPKITFVNDIQNNVKKYKFYFINYNLNDSQYQITLPQQKWNNFVFNYKDNIVDLFVNGNLEKTYVNNYNVNLEKMNLANNLNDQIIVGENDGLYGAICNVKYYFQPLTKFQISNMYNLIMNKNPPTNNL